MSKGIIVVDIPDKCDGCEMCGTLIGKVICVATIKKLMISMRGQSGAL